MAELQWGRAASLDFDDEAVARMVAQRYRLARRWARYAIDVRETSGGKWFIAAALRPVHESPCAAEGLTSYRYVGAFGFVMIGARDHGDALREAARSLEGEPDPARLEIWSDEAAAYVRCN